MNESIFEKAIRLGGGTAEIARSLGISSQAVSQWKIVPADQVLKVAAATDYMVTPHELRSDLYPFPTDGVPADKATA